MFLFLLTTATLAQYLIFEDYFTSTTLDSTLWDTSNATQMSNTKIVTCPGATNDNCLTFTKQAVGGALYTKPIPIENQQDITIEFKYLTKSTTKKGPYSNLFVGYTDKRRSGFCWTASGYSYTSTVFISNSGYNSEQYLCKGYEAVLIQDLLDSWKIIKFTIPSKYLISKSMNEIILVFEDFEAGFNDPGAYYLTSIIGYYNKNCTSYCNTCTTFYDCTSCADTHRWLEGKCYLVDCGNSLEQTIPYGKDKLEESTTATSYTATITIPGYYFVTCWPAQWVTLDVQDGKFTEVPFSYNSNSESATMVISQSNITQINCLQSTSNSNEFTCNFHFNVHFNEQIMYEKNWTAIIDFSKSATQTSVVKYDASNLPALAIPIESRLEYCTDVEDCVWTTSNITLILNQFFKVKLSLVDSNLYSWKMEPGYVKLSGSGTLYSLTILESDTSTPGTIIYKTKLEIKGSKGTGIVVAAKITNPNKGSRRRILDGVTASINATISLPNDGVAVGQLSSTLITFKSRELKIEDNPEYSPLVGILVLLLLAM